MATQGGPATQVSVQTSGPLQGGPALPVAVVADGRPELGGPAQPVYVVTSGPVQGGPAVPIVQATAASSVAGGPAIPVYVVSGSLSPATVSSYLLRDLFSSGSVAAGTRTATPGPGTEVVMDSASKLSISGNRLVCGGAAATAWNDPSLWAGALDATIFGGCATLVRIQGSSQVGPALLLHGAANVAADAAGRGIFYDVYQWRMATSSLIRTNPGTLVRAIDYLLAIVRRPSGGDIVAISGGIYAAFPSATILWVDATDSITTDAYVGLSTKTNTGSWRSDQLQAVKASDLPAALQTQYGACVAADTFTRADGNINGSTTEVGGKTWSVWSGVGVITSDTLRLGNGTTYGRARIDAGVLPRIIETTITTGGTIAGREAYIDFRDNGTKRFSLAFDTTSLYIFDGYSNSTLISTGAVALQASTTYRIVVVDYGSTIKAIVNNTEWLSASSVDGASATQCGLTAKFTDVIFDNFAVWPSTITLPTDLGPFPSPPAGTGAILASDNFAGVDGTALSTHDPAWSTFGTGSWEIRSAAAQLTAAAASGYAVRNAFGADHEAQVTITLPAAPGVGDWNCGLIIRHSDSSNYIIARYIYQSNSPEIEVFQTLGGSSTLIGFVQLGPGTLGGGSTHTMRAAASGSEVAIYHDGELVVQAITPLTGTNAGMGIDVPASGQPAFATWSVKAA